MFILNNKDNRDYKGIFTDVEGVVFDLSEKQISNKVNSDWLEISEGDLACVISASRKMSTIYKVSSPIEYGEIKGEKGGVLYVITGKVVAKVPGEPEMTPLLNKFNALHKRLPGNQYSNGFNVANLGSQLDALQVKSRAGLVSLAELKCQEIV
ncbi:hypothetical protein ACU8V4_14205 [Pseudoalteromonas mariniglutinosa]